jgi:protein-disulfide isomerase
MWHFNENRKERYFMRLLLILMTLSMAMISPAMAQISYDPDPPEALEKMVEQGNQIFYLGEFEGMKGWALIRQGKPEFFYQNREGTALIMGLMFNQDGEMVTMGQLRALYQEVGDDMYAATGGSISNLPPLNEKTSIADTVAPQNQTTTTTTTTTSSQRPVVTEADLTPAKRMFADLLTSNWVTLNPNGQYDIFAFIDPDCPHCKSFLRDAEPFMTNDGLRLRVIPIGMSDSALKKAALLLASANPEERLMAYAKGDQTQLNAPDNINTAGVESNVTMMFKHGFDVTPIIVYRTNKGEIRMIRGKPSDYNMVINDIVEN